MKYLAVILATLFMFGCAPMPGPKVSTRGLSDMNIEEVMQHADAARDDGAMLDQHYKDLQCKPMSAYDSYKKGYLKVEILPQLEVTATCVAKTFPSRSIFTTTMLLLGMPPAACTVSYGSVMKMDETCWFIGTIYVADWKNKYLLLHELRHANGYPDKLY